jgi:hypothetical protein
LGSGLVAADQPLRVVAGIRDAALADRSRHVARQVVHVQALEELERPAPRAVEGDREGRTLAAGQDAAGQRLRDPSGKGPEGPQEGGACRRSGQREGHNHRRHTRGLEGADPLVAEVGRAHCAEPIE